MWSMQHKKTATKSREVDNHFVKEVPIDQVDMWNHDRFYENLDSGRSDRNINNSLRHPLKKSSKRSKSQNRKKNHTAANPDVYTLDNDKYLKQQSRHTWARKLFHSSNGHYTGETLGSFQPEEIATKTDTMKRVRRNSPAASGGLTTSDTSTVTTALPTVSSSAPASPINRFFTSWSSEEKFEGDSRHHLPQEQGTDTGEFASNGNENTRGHLVGPGITPDASPVAPDSPGSVDSKKDHIGILLEMMKQAFGDSTTSSSKSNNDNKRGFIDLREKHDWRGAMSFSSTLTSQSDEDENISAQIFQSQRYRELLGQRAHQQRLVGYSTPTPPSATRMHQRNSRNAPATCPVDSPNIMARSNSPASIFSFSGRRVEAKSQEGSITVGNDVGDRFKRTSNSSVASSSVVSPRNSKASTRRLSSPRGSSVASSGARHPLERSPSPFLMQRIRSRASSSAASYSVPSPPSSPSASAFRRRRQRIQVTDKDIMSGNEENVSDLLSDGSSTQRLILLPPFLSSGKNSNITRKKDGITQNNDDGKSQAASVPSTRRRSSSRDNEQQLDGNIAQDSVSVAGLSRSSQKSRQSRQSSRGSQKDNTKRWELVRSNSPNERQTNNKGYFSPDEVSCAAISTLSQSSIISRVSRAVSSTKEKLQQRRQRKKYKQRRKLQAKEKREEDIEGTRLRHRHRQKRYGSESNSAPSRNVGTQGHYHRNRKYRSSKAQYSEEKKSDEEESYTHGYYYGEDTSNDESDYSYYDDDDSFSAFDDYTSFSSDASHSSDDVQGHEIFMSFAQSKYGDKNKGGASRRDKNYFNDRSLDVSVESVADFMSDTPCNQNHCNLYSSEYPNSKMNDLLFQEQDRAEEKEEELLRKKDIFRTIRKKYETIRAGRTKKGVLPPATISISPEMAGGQPSTSAVPSCFEQHGFLDNFMRCGYMTPHEWFIAAPHPSEPN